MSCCSNYCKKAVESLKGITVEPLFFLFAFGHGLNYLIVQSLYIEKVCSVNLNYSREVCADIRNYDEIQIETQKYVSVLQGWNSVLQALPAIVYGLFAGPWSDKNGRKILIILACLGCFINNGVYIINAIWWDSLKAEYLLFECLQDCTGGYSCFYLGCYSYLSDISGKKTRTKRLGFLDGLHPLGFFVGIGLSGYVKAEVGFIGTFLISALAALLVLTYTIFILKDSRDNLHPEVVEAMRIAKEKEEEEERLEAEKNGGSVKNVKIDNVGDDQVEVDAPPKGFFAKACQALRGFFAWKNLKKSITVTFRKREYFMRSILILTISTFLLQAFLGQGKGPTYMLFFRKEFKMTEKQYGPFVVFFGILSLIAQFVCLPLLSHRLGVHDALIGILAVGGHAIEALMQAFLREIWLLIVAGIIAIMGSVGTTVCRAMITKTVGPSEVGAALAVVASFQALVPVVSAPMYGYLYKATVETFPGAFLILSAAGYTAAGILFLIIYIALRRINQLKLANGDVEDNEKEETVTEETAPEELLKNKENNNSDDDAKLNMNTTGETETL